MVACQCPNSLVAFQAGTSKKGQGVARPVLNIGARREWAVSGTPRPLYPSEGDPVPGLDGCGKSHPHRVSNPRTVLRVAGRHTDYAIPVAEKYICNIYHILNISSKLSTWLCLGIGMQGGVTV